MARKPAKGSPPPGWLARLAGRVRGLGQWQALALSFLLGLIAVLALPPLYLAPALVPAFTGLVWLLDGAGRGWAAFLRAWSFALGYFLGGLYWIAIAFLVEAERFGPFGPVAVLGLSLGLGLFVAAALWTTRRYGWSGPSRILCLAGAWLVSELLRGWLLTGFPWNLIGSVWAMSPLTLQGASLVGAWGLSLLTVFAAAAPATLGDGGSLRQGLAPSALAALLLLSAGAFGAVRLSAAPAPDDVLVPNVKLRLVQPDIPQDSKWADDQRAEHLRRQLRMSLAPGYQSISHVIWSETAVPYLLNRADGLQSALAEVAPTEGAIIVGAPRGEAAANGGTDYWNSLFAFDKQGRQVALYDKAHLVPFGEYVPLRGLFGLSKLTAGRADFSAGPGVTLLQAPGLPPFSALICYEIIFPAAVTPERGPRPAWLLNLTNDNWFGKSSGPYQHLAAARLRAVEEGLPVVRAANGGISVSIDPYGRFLGKLPLGTSGLLDVGLAEPLPEGTVFSRTGRLNPFIFMGLFSLLAFPLRRLTQ